MSTRGGGVDADTTDADAAFAAGDVLIPTRALRNRAFDGDVVAVRLEPVVSDGSLRGSVRRRRRTERRRTERRRTERRRHRRQGRGRELGRERLGATWLVGRPTRGPPRVASRPERRLVPTGRWSASYRARGADIRRDHLRADAYVCFRPYPIYIYISGASWRFLSDRARVARVASTAQRSERWNTSANVFWFASTGGARRVDIRTRACFASWVPPVTPTRRRRRSWRVSTFPTRRSSPRGQGESSPRVTGGPSPPMRWRASTRHARRANDVHRSPRMRGRGRRRVRLGVARRRRVGGGRAHRGRVESSARAPRWTSRRARGEPPCTSSIDDSTCSPRCSAKISRRFSPVAIDSRRRACGASRAPDMSSLAPPWFGKTVIRSNHQLHYYQAQAIADGAPPPSCEDFLPPEETARVAEDLAVVSAFAAARHDASNPRGRGGTRLRGTPFRDDVGRRAVGGVDQGRGAHDARRGGTHDRRQRRRRRARARRVPILRLLRRARAAEADGSNSSRGYATPRGFDRTRRRARRCRDRSTRRRESRAIPRRRNCFAERRRAPCPRRSTSARGSPPPADGADTRTTDSRWSITRTSRRQSEGTRTSSCTDNSTPR